jgi:hypothetical protein
MFDSLKRVSATLALGTALFASWAYWSHAARAADGADADPALVRSAHDGPWSSDDTWQGGKVPTAGARVQIQTGHHVVYDIVSDQAIRSIHVAGRLAFAPDRDTRLDVGLIKIQAGQDASEEGFDCDAHINAAPAGLLKPALEVGTAERPIDTGHTALIRLVYFPALSKQSCPAIVCCAGRMDLHGAPLERTWVKLGATAKKGSRQLTLAEPASGWRVGDRVIVTASKPAEMEEGTRRPKGRNRPALTEERTIAAVGDGQVTLDKPLDFEHTGEGDYRAEIANLSRNVIVESADLDERGHTMYHRGSAGSISYAEFRHLGKEGVLGRYSLHYHLVGDTMRGSSVVGASIWDSGNRWLTIHGTNYLVVRDCVGYQSVGHGFFLEDGTEVYNVLDRNLAVQAFIGKKLPKQVLPFDQNEGAGFWWANSHNTFTRNVSCENDRYGYRFEATAGSDFDPTRSIMQPDGSRQPVDIRTLPFVRFDDNESHCEGLYGMNLGEGVDRVGPDVRHPFVIRNLRVWGVNYALRPQSPSLLLEGLFTQRANYGIYHPNFDHHVYRDLHINGDLSEPFNRGHDDLSVQHGVVTVDGLTFENVRGTTDQLALIQISDNNPTGKAESHFRNVQVRRHDDSTRALVDLGGGDWNPPVTPRSVPIYLHDFFGPGRHAKVASTAAKDLLADGNVYRQVPLFTGNRARLAEVVDVAFPTLLDPVDDLPPVSMITHVRRTAANELLIRGTTADNGTVKSVQVNGIAATALAPNFAQWEAVVPASAAKELQLEAISADEAGNVEPRPHTLSVAQGG